MMSQMAGSMGLPGMGPMSKKARGRQMQAQSKKGKKGKGGRRRLRPGGPIGAPGGCRRVAGSSRRRCPEPARAAIRPGAARTSPSSTSTSSRTTGPAGERRRCTCPVWCCPRASTATSGSATGGSPSSRSPARRPISRGGWLLPGLVDAHCHVGIGAGGAALEDLAAAREQALDRAGRRGAGAARLRLARRHPGWTTSRTCRGSSAPAGTSPPRAATSPAWRSRSSPPTWSPRSGVQARRGDGWVKLVGDWIDRDDRRPGARVAGRGARPPRSPRRTSEGARVTAHTLRHRALPGLIGAGIDCIEHGTGLTEDLVAEMAARGTAVVPTLVNLENFPASPRRGRPSSPRYAKHDAAAVRAVGTPSSAPPSRPGVPIFAGTDAGGGIEHGVIADEVAALHAAGLPAEEALAAAPGAPGRGSGSRASRRARRPTSSCTTATRGRTWLVCGDRG